MNRLLLRRDQGTDNLLMPAFIGLGVALVLRAFADAENAGPLYSPDNPGVIWFIHNFIVWSMLLAGLIGSHFWLRSSRLNLALPLSARALWLTRMTAICIGCGVIVLVLALVHGVSYAPDRGLFVHGVVWLGSLRMGSVFLLMLMLLQAPEPRLRKLETTAWYIAYTIIIWLLCALLLLLGPRSAWLAAPVLAAASLIGRRTWRHLPRAFLLEASESDHGFAGDPLAPGPTWTVETPRPGHGAATFPRNGHSRALLHRTLFRLMHNHWLGWLFGIMLVIYGLIMTIYYVRGRDPLMMLFYFFMFAYGSWNQSLLRIHPVDAWPVSRRLFFAHAMLPLAVMYLAGAGLGLAIQQTRSSPPAMVHYERGLVEVPYEFREIAPDGAPRAVTTPWGETHMPTGTRILPWSDAVVYNPYEIAHDTSMRLDALQIDRAVAAVHGGPPPDPARYADLEMNGAQGAAACCSGFDLQDSRGRGSELRAKTFALLVAVFCLVGIPLLLLGTLSLDPRALEWVRTRAALAAAMVPLGLFAALLLMSAFSDVGTWAQAAWLMITLRRAAESLPLSAGQCWTGVAAVLALCYLIMQERFARLEASHALVKKKQQENY